MPTDCEALSDNAQAIFAKLQPFYPPDPWDKPQWEAVGRIFDNGWHDLRLAADREKMTRWYKNLLGYLVEMSAIGYMRDHSTLEGFTQLHFTDHMRKVGHELLILNELDFQIETMDLVES